jgi:hypothetical protein
VADKDTSVRENCGLSGEDKSGSTASTLRKRRLPVDNVLRIVERRGAPATAVAGAGVSGRPSRRVASALRLRVGRRRSSMRMHALKIDGGLRNLSALSVGSKLSYGKSFKSGRALLGEMRSSHWTC